MGYYWIWDEDTEEYKKASDFYCNLIGYSNIPQAELESFERDKIFNLDKFNYHGDARLYLTDTYLEKLKIFSSPADIHIYYDYPTYLTQVPFATSNAKVALPRRDYEKNCPKTRNTSTDNNYIPFRTRYLLTNDGQSEDKNFPWYSKDGSDKKYTKWFSSGDTNVPQKVMLIWYASDTKTIRYTFINNICSYTTTKIYDIKGQELYTDNNHFDVIKSVTVGQCHFYCTSAKSLANSIKNAPSAYGQVLYNGDYAQSYIYIALQGPGAGGGCGHLDNWGLGAGAAGGGGGGGGAFMTIALNLSKCPDKAFLLYSGCGTRPEKLKSAPGWETRSGIAKTPCGSFLANYVDSGNYSGDYKIIAYAEGGYGGGNAGWNGARGKSGPGGKTAYYCDDIIGTHMVIIDKICGGDGGIGGAYWSRGLVFSDYTDHHADNGADASNTLQWNPIYTVGYTIDKTTKVKNSKKNAVLLTLGGHESMAGTGGHTSAGGGGGGAVCAARYEIPGETERTKGRDLLGYGGGGYGSSSEEAEVHNGGWGLPGFVAIIDVY